MHGFPILTFQKSIKSGEETPMKKIAALLVFAAVAAVLAGCGAKTMPPSYTSANPDLMRIGGDEPSSTEPVILNLGSYCLQVRDEWKADVKTPDGFTIWTKDSYRKVVPCPRE
jgi:predicted small lipoprotein YifL